MKFSKLTKNNQPVIYCVFVKMRPCFAHENCTEEDYVFGFKIIDKEDSYSKDYMLDALENIGWSKGYMRKC